MRTRSLILTAMITVAGCLVAQAQTPTITGIVNNATPNAGNTPIAPGELVSVNGTNLGDATFVGCGSPAGIPNSCGGVSVTIDGKTAPVRNEVANQLIIQAPVDLTGASAVVVVTRVTGGQTLVSQPFTATVVPTAPQMYFVSVNNMLFGNCFSSGSQVSPSNAVLPGALVRCLGTGFGVTNPVVPTGQVQPQSPLPAVVAAVRVTVAGQNATVNSASLSQGNTVGQNQVIFTVPQGVPGGNQPVVVNVGGVNAFPLQLAIGAAGPNVTTLVNSASNAIFGLPNAGVAPGSIVVAYGNKLGPDTLVTASGYPWPSTLSGTSAQVTVGGTTVNLLLYYTSANQIAGLLPSSTPAGQGAIKVTYNGQTGGPSPINVQQNNFGVYTVSQNGAGPGIVTFADYSLVSQTKAANPGETLIIWGTGLGPVAGNEAAGPLPGDMTNLPVQVFAGGVSATVVYRGRSGCCVGEDQIVFVVPNVTGCNVPLAIQINNRVSNYSLLAVAPGGRACVPAYSVIPDAFSAIPQPKVLFAQLRRNINPPPQFPGDQPSGDDASVSPFKLGISGAQLNVLNDGLSFGSCLVTIGNTPRGGDPPIVGLLDAGPSLTLQGPAGTTRTLAKSGFEYSAHLGDTSPGNFLDAGAYTLSGTGGADIGSFTGTFTIPQFTWTNRPVGNAININRSQGVTITWTGGDPNGFVQIIGGDGGPGVNAGFLCYVRGDAGTFTVPPSVLLALPHGGGGLTVQNNPAVQIFAVPGADLSGVSSRVNITSFAQYQ